MQSMLEKLNLKDEKNVLIQGLPSSIEKQFAKLSYAKNVTPLLKSRKIDFALVFAIHQNQMCAILNDVFPALHADSKLWIAYPKAASKIASDLNRECSWQVLQDHDYEAGDQAVLDHVWSAICFKKLDVAQDQISAEEERANEDFDKRLIKLPAELEIFFIKHKKAKDFFKSLPEISQKEYVNWIEDAKRADTKKRRLEAVQQKLLDGKKTLSEK
jgi:hypothetical protein